MNEISKTDGEYEKRDLAPKKDMFYIKTIGRRGNPKFDAVSLFKAIHI
jgi:hypothetical protein